MGRPPKPVADRRTSNVHVRFTPDERAALVEAAAGRTLELSAWCREVLLAAARGASEGHLPR